MVCEKIIYCFAFLSCFSLPARLNCCPGIADSGIDLASCYFADPAYAAAHGGRAAPFFDLNAAADSTPRAPTADDRTHRKVVQYVWLGDTTDDALGHGTHTAGSLAGRALADALSPSGIPEPHPSAANDGRQCSLK